MIGPTLINDLAWKGYLIFMCFNLVFVPLLYFFYPETANLSLEEIDSLFMHKSPQSLDSSEEWKEPIVVTTSVETLKE
ncbi:hypothetical protein APSETT444_002485 [Aspergillus pseudonomiae]